MANPKTDAYLHIQDLKEGSHAKIKAMLCRKWDVVTIPGKYISTDFIISDDQGTIIHCTAKSNIAHFFVHKLEEGAIYTIKNIQVIPNKKEYKIIQSNTYMLELDGSTIMTKVVAPHEGFVRYPFELVEFDDVRSSNPPILIDVVGYVTNVGTQTHTKVESKALDFYLINERGQRLRVTLWGILGDELLQRKAQNETSYPVILVFMNVKEYKNVVNLSSPSVTRIFDDVGIPLLQKLQERLRDNPDQYVAINLPGQHPAAQEISIAALLKSSRAAEQVGTFRCHVNVKNIRTKNSWYYLACSSGKCMKSITRLNGMFWCLSCEQTINFPKPSFKLQLDVEDETGGMVITMFNDTAEQLLKTTAEKLLQELTDAGADDTLLPDALIALIDNSQTLEVKGHSYFHSESFESFTCSGLIPTCNPPNQDFEEHAFKRLRRATTSSATPLSDKQKENTMLPLEETDPTSNSSNMSKTQAMISEEDRFERECPSTIAAPNVQKISPATPNSKRKRKNIVLDEEDSPPKSAAEEEGLPKCALVAAED